MTSAKPKRRQLSDTANLAIAKQDCLHCVAVTLHSAVRAEFGNEPCAMSLAERPPSHPLLVTTPKDQDSAQSSYCGARSFRRMILYRDHVLIGCLFDLPPVSKALRRHWGKSPLGCSNLHHVLTATIMFKFATWRAVPIGLEMSYEQSFHEN
jgi:hypothetical protein